MIKHNNNYRLHKYQDNHVINSDQFQQDKQTFLELTDFLLGVKVIDSLVTLRTHRILI